ncbi:putative metalloprotease arx1 [Physocladia obscura]|uniref:Metalloprotease arx1 n=1 Tax=Physocladia obscura TaxID=109957 RepID=A0AAD5SQ69_9FUNG|nr:putative metalloprotease arx1 [Physocladia obscura]
MSQLARQMQMVDALPDQDDSTWNNLADTTVMQKYQMAGGFANAALRTVLSGCVAGASVGRLCTLGDEYILSATAGVFTGKGKAGSEVERGIAFPTCVNVNSVVLNHASAADDGLVLAAGDVVKVELGVHVDGYVATAAHTLLVGNNGGDSVPVPVPATGRVADAVCAAHVACEAAVRLVRGGASHAAVFQAVNRVAAAFGVRPVVGTASHVVRRFLLEADARIEHSSDPADAPAPAARFADNDVVAINIVMTDAHDPRLAEADFLHAAVLQRDVGLARPLRLQAARNAFNDAAHVFGVFPFSEHALIRRDRAHRLGLPEVIKSGLLAVRPVYVSAEPTATTAHFKATVLVLPNNQGSMRLTAPFSPPYVHSDKSIDDETAALLKQDVRIAKAKTVSSAHANTMDMS